MAAIRSKMTLTAGELIGGPARVRGYHTGATGAATAGQITVRDGGAGGTIVLDLFISMTGNASVDFGDRWLDFKTDVYVSVITAGCAITLFYD